MEIDEVFNPKSEAPPVAYEATVANDPDIDEGMKVVIEAFDLNKHFGPLPWTPRVDPDGAVLLPVRGNRALVLFSNDHLAWVIAWWPY